MALLKVFKVVGPTIAITDIPTITKSSPGRKILINSDGFNALATIEAVRFAGSTFGPDWEAELISP